MTKTTFKEGQQFGKWRLDKYISAGGNGEVWKATLADDTSRVFAIKILKKTEKIDYVRFGDEVKILSEHNDIKGLLQIIDKNLPGDKNNPPWYVMPLATPLNAFINGKTTYEQIVDIIISVSNTLSELHDRGISHRDIKPANILVKDSELYLSDFGLVEYPTKQDITIEKKDVGARWTIAPEMRRNPHTADGKLADVYSIAKTLWILLTKEEKGFEGQYNIGSSIEIKNFVSSIYCSPIDNLIHRCTDHDPKMRHDIKMFIDDLVKWKELNSDFKQRSKSEWVDIQRKLFPTAMPKTVIWEDIVDITRILNIISENDQINHTMLPSGGGLDLESAKLSSEEGCIELILGGRAYIVKPSKLIFEGFEGNSDWNYFRLDTIELMPIADYNHSREYERLTELEPGIYADDECYYFDDFSGEKLPVSARPVVRMVTEGSFMICLKTGAYNGIPETYDGRHNKVSANEFRKYIEKSIESVNLNKLETSKEIKASSNFKTPKFLKSTKIRRGSKILNHHEVKLLETVINLFKKSQNEDEKIRKDTGMETNGIGGINFFEESSILALEQYMRSPKPCNDAFKRYIKSLSNHKLALIEAVMYGGRDVFSSGRAYPLDEMLSSFIKESRQNRIRSITEKFSLDEYLLAGINAYK